MKIENYFDLNILLRAVNLLLCFLGIVGYSVKGGNQYVDIVAICLLCVFCAENIIFLLYEKKQSNQFVIILVGYATLFYALRVVTLLGSPYSIVLGRNAGFSFQNLNHTLLFIMLSNAAIFLGLVCRGGLTQAAESPSHAGILKIARPSGILFVLFIAAAVNFYGALFAGSLGRLVGFAQVFALNLPLIILFACNYFILNYRNIPKIYSGAFGVLLLMIIALQTLGGSRSGVLGLFVALVLTCLAIKSRIQFTRKYLFVPVMLILLSFVLFSYATRIRTQLGTDRLIIRAAQLNILAKAYDLPFRQMGYVSVNMFDRLGFLDYSADAIVNKDKYAKVVNFNYYFKSIVDNCLTPGFNVFGSPKVANCLIYIHSGLPDPTHADVLKAYQSDMITLYGDYYILFGGYFSLIVLFILAFLFKSVFNLIQHPDPFIYYLSRAITLYVFYLWLNDFGVDWLFFDLICIAITSAWLRALYQISPKVEVSPRPL